jgi:photosystem II stability/assembly factor-like uncharacterized protein
MKTIISSLITVLLINISSFAQSGWIQQTSSTTRTLNDVFFIDPQKGWIVADSGTFLKTTNGGVNWTVQSLPFYRPLNTVFFINENVGYAGGGFLDITNFGYVYKTTDGGDNWIVLDYGDIVNDILFTNANTGFLGINSTIEGQSIGSISRTSNSGMNWSQEFTSYICHSLSFSSQQTGYSVGHYWDDTSNDTSIVMKTTDYGITWETKFKNANVWGHGFLRSVFSIDNNVWVAGRYGLILNSTDNGESWSNQPTPGSNSMNSIFFANANTGWAVGDRQVNSPNIIKTTNSGSMWFNLDNSFGSMKSVYFVNDLTGWAVGENGVIVKTTTGGITSVSNIGSEIPDRYYLSQNYPNPFNPRTIINYELRIKNFVMLRVYDIAGREVATLVNDIMQAGKHAVEFNAEGLPSGVYIYSLNVDGKQIGVRRMTLVK